MQTLHTNCNFPNVTTNRHQVHTDNHDRQWGIQTTVEFKVDYDRNDLTKTTVATNGWQQATKESNAYRIRILAVNANYGVKSQEASKNNKQQQPNKNNKENNSTKDKSNTPISICSQHKTELGMKHDSKCWQCRLRRHNQEQNKTTTQTCQSENRIALNGCELRSTTTQTQQGTENEQVSV